MKANEKLQHRGGTDGEDLHLIDGNTGEVIDKLTSSNSDKSVDYRPETLAAIDRTHDEGRYIIAIHNHPNGLPPTLDDGSSAFAHRYDQDVVVGHNLEVWTYGQTRTVIPTAACELLHNGLSEKLSKGIDFDDELWYDLLRKVGMEVSRR